MNSATSELKTQSRRPVISDAAPESSAKPLEVNVIFTEQRATYAALKAAQTLAQGLGACLHLRAAIAVPMRLPLDRPPIRLSFFERLLHDLVGQSGQDAEPVIHLYICRDWIGTLMQVVSPSSIVVIGGRKRWWPSRDVRIASALEARGNRVAFIDATPKRHDQEHPFAGMRSVIAR